jgi:hypothetical protein
VLGPESVDMSSDLKRHAAHGVLFRACELQGVAQLAKALSSSVKNLAEDRSVGSTYAAMRLAMTVAMPSRI